jgi:hypothetical protein
VAGDVAQGGVRVQAALMGAVAHVVDEAEGGAAYEVEVGGVGTGVRAGTAAFGARGGGQGERDQRGGGEQSGDRP